MPASKTKKPGRKSKPAEWRTGARGLGLATTGTMRVVRQNRMGFPYSRFATFEKRSGLPRDKMAEFVGIPLQTLSKRQTEGKLRPEESDRLLRASILFGMAVELFEGDVGAAREWLLTPQPGLGGEVPLEFASTEAGAREVENLVGRLEQGVFS